jgi:23S rRNA pseudouridine2605 synthase
LETKSTRLAKRIAESGVTSRRDAEKLIEAGRVVVNGEIVTTPVFFVADSDEILVDGAKIPGVSEEIILWKFHKPRGVITTRRDPQNRKTVFDFFPEAIGRLLCVGRLDYNSEGLLLLVNNGLLARRLELPSSGFRRTYLVRFFGSLSDEHIRELKSGITVEGVRYGPIDLRPRENQTTAASSMNSWATATLSEGKNREIRKVLEHFGCRVNRLIRTAYGPVKLGDLPPGKISRIPPAETTRLLKTIDKL